MKAMHWAAESEIKQAEARQWSQKPEAEPETESEKAEWSVGDNAID